MKLYDPPHWHPELGYIPLRLRGAKRRLVDVRAAGWSPRVRGEYRRLKANGLVLEADHDCSYAPSVPGLRFVVTSGWSRIRMSDDSPFFSLRSLDDLELNYRTQQPISPNVQSLAVNQLLLGARPGLDSLRNHSTLRSLTLEVDKQVRDLAWLGVMPHLEEIELRGAGQELDVSQLVHQPLLRSIILSNVTFADLAWAPNLRGELVLLSLFDVASTVGPFDIAPLAAVPSLREVRIGEPVLSTQPLLERKGEPLKFMAVHERNPAADSSEEPINDTEASVRVLDEDGVFTVYLPVGSGAPGDEGMINCGYSPSGRLWQEVVHYLVQSRAPELQAYKDDSESDTLALETSDPSVADGIRDLLAPYVDDADLMSALLQEATTNGFRFDAQSS